MQHWFTADTHFGHGNIIKYCHRPFLSREERAALRDDPRGRLRLSDETVRRHDGALLEAIDARVAAADQLWIVGDFCWGGGAEARHDRDRIRCEKVFLVWGNHDRGMIRVEGQEIWLNHYPMRSWNKAFHGSWHVYGHVHGRLRHEDERNAGMPVEDVGVDACEYKPIGFAELSAYIAPRVAAFTRNTAALLAGQDAALPV